MNHTRVAIRFSISLFWLIVAGVSYTAVSNSVNAHSLSWVTWLVYAAIGSVVLYVGFFVTKCLWSIK